jgi:hypothetical protein
MAKQVSAWWGLGAVAAGGVAGALLGRASSNSPFGASNGYGAGLLTTGAAGLVAGLGTERYKRAGYTAAGIVGVLLIAGTIRNASNAVTAAATPASMRAPFPAVGAIPTADPSEVVYYAEVVR